MSETKKKRSLSDMGRQTAVVEVDYVDGEKEVYTLHLPSAQRVAEIRDTVDWPLAPIDIDPISKRRVRDENDPTYQRQMGEASTVFNFRLLADALKEELDIPGDTIAEQGAAVRSQFTGVLASMLITELTSGGIKKPEEREKDRAAAFPK